MAGPRRQKTERCPCLRRARTDSSSSSRLKSGKARRVNLARFDRVSMASLPLLEATSRRTRQSGGKKYLVLDDPGHGSLRCWRRQLSFQGELHEQCAEQFITA